MRDALCDETLSESLANQAGRPRVVFGMGKIILMASLLALLAAAIWFAARGWMSIESAPMPAEGYIALALGVIFSLVVGCGLMMLVFYSARHGYDEPARRDPSDRE